MFDISEGIVVQVILGTSLKTFEIISDIHSNLNNILIGLYTIKTTNRCNKMIIGTFQLSTMETH